MGVAIFVCVLGGYRFWLQQNAMLRGKIYAGGWDLTTIGVAITLVSLLRACPRRFANTPLIDQILKSLIIIFALLVAVSV